MSRHLHPGVIAALFGVAFAIALPSHTALAQQKPAVAPARPPVLTLNQDRLFQQSAWGRAALARAEADTAALAAENRRIEDALEKEERSLTERRAALPAKDFARLATDFDAKVEGIRTAQDTKSRDISRRLDADRQQFFAAASPVLGRLLEESGAVAILADSAIILSLTALDATDLAIARMDKALPAPAPAPPPSVQVPAPAPVPAPTPAQPTSP